MIKVDFPYGASVSYMIRVDGVEALVAATDRLGRDMREVEYSILEEWEEQIRTLLGRATSTWDSAPGFDTQKRGFMVNKFARLGSPFAMGWIDLKIGRGSSFYYVDQGTQGPYMIRPKDFPYLAFQAQYKRKTPYAPGLGAVAGGPSGEWVYTQRAVVHPGIQATHMSVTAMERAMDALDPMMEREFNAATSRWGE